MNGFRGHWHFLCSVLTANTINAPLILSGVSVWWLSSGLNRIKFVFSSIPQRGRWIGIFQLWYLSALYSLICVRRKLIRRLATPDLMFGHMVAPPPSTTKDLVGINDMLSCFNETGSPARSDLSPIAMVTSPPQISNSNSIFLDLRKMGRLAWYAKHVFITSFEGGGENNACLSVCLMWHKSTPPPPKLSQAWEQGYCGFIIQLLGHRWWPPQALHIQVIHWDYNLRSFKHYHTLVPRPYI